MSDRPSSRESDADPGREPIRVWWAALDRDDGETVALGGPMSEDEHARAARFRFERDRRRFTVTRGLLRLLIGRLLGVAPSTIEFSYGTRGKPALRRPEGSGLEFNLSHSNGQALYAVSWGRPVGVDLEYQRPEFDFLGIADRFFTPQEFGEITALPEEARRSAFFRGWARKEAFLKARGDGLWLGLDQFAVSIDPAIPARVVRTAWDPDEARRWTLVDLDVTGGFSAALAVEGPVSGPIDVDVLEGEA